MNRRNKENGNVYYILVDLEDLAQILSVGKNQARRVAELAGARVVLPSSKTARYNVDKIREYINQNTY